MSVPTSPLTWLTDHQPQILAELIEFARIPSVSTDPAHKPDVLRAAEWVAAQLRAAGITDVRVLQTTGHPVVYAQSLLPQPSPAGAARAADQFAAAATNAPTLLIYGHYDVQPPDPLDKWLSPPFEPQLRDGKLYARGVSDDKGPLLIAIKAAQAFMATRGALPLNVKFMFEGEEEIGSPSLEQFIASHTELLKADVVLSADGAMWRIDEPSLTIASRGLAGLEFSLRGASKDLHSGRYGGSVANALHAMAELVASLHTPDGRVAVAGFYDDVAELPASERAAIAKLPYDDARFQTQVGAPALVGEPGYGTLERQWIRPTLEVNGMWGGYQGPGSKTVTPAEAHCKISCRLVPNQRPDQIRALVIRHLESHLPAGVTLSVDAHRHGALPYLIPAAHPGLRAAQHVLHQLYEQEPLIVRMGGTLPVSEQFKRLLGSDTVFFSFSTADEDYHSPNEFFRVQRLYDGLQAWAMYFERFASGT